MELKIIKTGLNEVKSFRTLFLQENNFQFVCNKCHDYGWADTYLFIMDGQKIGYGSVWGTDHRQDRDTIFEFYVIKPFRKFAGLIFSDFLTVADTVSIESQTNDSLLTTMLYEYGQNIHAEAILFEDDYRTDYAIPGVVFREKESEDIMGEDDSDYVLELEGEIVATGGLMLNYNLPYADIYMQVKEPFRKQGLGCLIVQELKNQAYDIGRVPAARCNVDNKISKATLLKAGLKACGFRLKGDIKKTKVDA